MFAWIISVILAVGVVDEINFGFSYDFQYEDYVKVITVIAIATCFRFLIKICMYYIKGGNIRSCADRLANLHFDNNQDYARTFEDIITNLIWQQQPNNINYIPALSQNMIANYVDLAALQLNTLAAPRGTSYQDTKHDFKHNLAEYLRKRKIPEALITGDNRHLTLHLVLELRNSIR